MKLMNMIVAGLLLVLFSFAPVALAHTGSPTPTTWSAGAVLTSTNLNDTISHLHNTFSAGIVDAHISASASIAHTKLATPALIHRAWAVVTTNCDGSAAAGTACIFNGSKVTGVTSSGTTAQWCLDLSYTPTNTNFGIQVTSASTAAVCMADSRSTGIACGAGTRHALIKCFDYAGAALNNVQFTVSVLDDD